MESDKNAQKQGEKFGRADSLDRDPVDISGNNDQFELAFHHPLFEGNVLLPTKPIDELYGVVKRALVLRETGLCLHAASGQGKSCALEMIKATLVREFPRLPIYLHDTHNQQIPSIRSFFKHFLATVRHSNKKGETYDLRERLVNCLIDDARISGMNVVLLLIDEANAMVVQDFKFLKDVYNDLAREGIQLVTILMGQDPDLPMLIDNLKAEGRLDLIGRFALRTLPFRGNNCIEDLVEILSGMDMTLDLNGTPWTKFFFKNAFQNGFRLENEANRFMEAIADVAPVWSGKSFEFPARQTFSAIRIFITDNCGYDAPQIQIPGDAWKNAVKSAKLREAMLLINANNQVSQVDVEV